MQSNKQKALEAMPAPFNPDTGDVHAFRQIVIDWLPLAHAAEVGPMQLNKLRILVDGQAARAGVYAPAINNILTQIKEGLSE